MNVENINKLIAHLERLIEVGNTKTFDLSTWYEVIDDEGYDDDEVPVGKEAQDILAKMEGRDELKKFDCNTSACIAGHAALMAASEGEEIWDVEDQAQEWLGLDNRQASNLFIPNLSNGGGAYEKVSVVDAIYALKAVRDTGEVSYPEHLGYSPKPGSWF